MTIPWSSLVDPAVSENTTEVVASKVSSDTKRDRNETSAQRVPRRSGRTRRKPAWQESGEYCVAVNKQVMI